MLHLKRTCITFLGLLLAAPTLAHAQVAVGFSGGLSLATLEVDEVGDDPEPDSRTGFMVGGFASFPLSDMISITPGLYYVQKGATLEDDTEDIEATFKLDYLEVPVLLQVGVAASDRAALSVFLGPSVSFEVGCAIEADDGTSSESVDCDDEFLGEGFIETKSVGFNAIFGAGVRFMTSENMFFLGNGGLDLGLTSIDDSEEDEDVKNSVWFAQVGLGWIVGG